MVPVKKLLAVFNDAHALVFRGGEGSEKDFFINNEQEAVQHGIQTRALCFKTYEMESVTYGNKELKSDPENYSEYRYVGIDKIYTRDELIAHILGSAPGRRSDDWPESDLDAFNLRETLSKISRVQRYPADSVYIVVEEWQVGIIHLEAGQKVFDKTGQQLWPKQSSPVLKKAPAPGPKP